MKRKRIKKSVAEHIYSSEQPIVNKNVNQSKNSMNSKPIFDKKNNKYER